MLVSKKELEARLKNFKRVIHNKKLALTPQKMAIFKILATTNTHPSVQEIYKHVKKKFPNISLATVYDNLKKFTKLGLCLEIPISKTITRYDAKLNNHAHLVDTITGQVSDLSLGKKLNLPLKIKGKIIKKIQVIYYI